MDNTLYHMSHKGFLELLDPNADSFTFQYFSDLPNVHSSAGIIHGTLDKYQEILSLNNRCHSFIGVCINETDGKGRKEENITRIRAVWHDDDRGYGEDIGFPIAPSVSVETSPGRYHHYFILNPDDDLSFEEFDAVMARMIIDYGSDPAARAKSQALRLVGFKNWKRHPESHVVRAIDGSGKRYSRSQILEAFGVPSGESLELIPKPQSGIQGFQPSTEVLSATDLDQERLTEALEYLPSDDYQTWFKYGLAIFDAFGGSEEGFKIWDDWSQTTIRGNYDKRENLRSWFGLFPKRAGREHKVTIGTLFYDAMSNGWEPFGSPRIPEESGSIIPGRLTEDTMSALRESFKEYNTSPSPAQMTGLRDLVSHLEAMANGTAEELFYLSYLDPGVGKTQSVSHFTKKLLESEAHKNVSVLICLGRLAEIRSIVDDMKLDQGDFAVFVTDIEENRELLSMGNPVTSAARVLFTTQQMLESRIKRVGSFEDASDFHYLGIPRQVRLWDEACLPARPFTVNMYGIEKLLEEAHKRRQIPGLHETLKKLAREVEGAEDGSIYDIPALDDIVPQSRAMAIYSEESLSTQNLVRDLWLLSGKSVCIRRQGENNVIAHYENTLPDDLKPVVICDASGRVRKTYAHWSDGRGDLVALQYGHKSYKPLTIHLWERGGGKTAWENNRETLVEGILNTVNDKPDEEFLILHHMKSNRFEVDVPGLITRGAVNPDRLFFAHWGGEDYRATNKYKDIKNVILAGTLFYDQGHYDALLRLSRAMSPDEKLNKEHLRQIERGEHAQTILQAVCRAAVRKSVGDRCGECHAYIIANPNTGIPEMLRDGEVFPNATVIPWTPVEEQLTGLVKKAFEYVDGYLTDNPKGELKASIVQKEIGVSDRTLWNNRILNHPDFPGALAKAGIKVVRGKGRGGNSFKLMAA